MSLIDQDYYDVMKAEWEAKDKNRFRFLNEPSEWRNAIWAELAIWYESDFTIYTRNFFTRTRWRPFPLLRSQYQDYVTGKPIMVQWTLKNGMDLELAVKRIGNYTSPQKST